MNRCCSWLKILALVLVLLIPDAVKAQTEEWIQIQNNAQGYSISCPASVIAQRYDPEGILRIEMSEHDAVLTIQVHTNPNILTAQQWTDTYLLNDSEDSVPKILVKDPSPITINGLIAETYDIVNSAGYIYRTMVLSKDDLVYLINYPVEQVYENAFEQMVDTFHAFTPDSSTGDQGFAVVNGSEPISAASSLPVPYYSQKDPQWVCDQIGTCTCNFDVCLTQSYSTIGDVGCLITSQAMVYEYYSSPNHFKNPQELDTCLTSWGYYGNAGQCTNGNCAAWYNPQVYSPNCRPSSVTYVGSTNDLGLLDNDLNQGRPAILNVDGGSHFVVAVGKSGGYYQINDPFYSRNQISPGEIGLVLRYNGTVPDSVPPTISFSAPVANQWYNTDQTVSWTITDNFLGVRGYKAAWNQNPPGSDEIPSSSGSATLSAAGQGWHMLYVRAWDNAGNASDVASAGWFGYDTVAPSNPTSASSGCSAAHNIWQNTCADPAFTWSGAGDATSGVAGYQLYWGSDSSGTSEYWTTSAAFDPGPVSAGTYYFRARTKDNAGNWSGWTTLFILRYDATAPIGSLTINNNASTSHTVLVYANSTASDAASGVAYMRLRDVGGAWTDWMGYSARMLWQLPGVTGKNYTVEVQFKDRAGNVSAVYQDAIALNIYPARPASASYRLARSTWGAVGSNGQSTSYRLLGTLSQPSMIGQPASANYRLSSGYWLAEDEGYAVYLPVALRSQP